MAEPHDRAAAAPPAPPAPPHAPAGDGDIDLAAVRDVDELIAMGTPRLKAALRARGMRAGGSAILLAERLWWKCKLSLFADDSRRRIARQKSRRPVGVRRYARHAPVNRI